MKKSGYADMPLHYGRVPRWLAERMGALGLAIVEAIVERYGSDEVLRRLSDPFWFQSLGCVMGMDWHSSGITTSVMGALKRNVNLRSKELGLYICGGRGKHSRRTPEELLAVADTTGLDGQRLVRCSRLSARIDNTAVQDGFQLYLHSFIVSRGGSWSVVQQGMNGCSRMARRYHWHSAHIQSFVEEPHSFIYGENRGLILNMTDRQAAPARSAIEKMAAENPGIIMREMRHLVMPAHHDVREGDVDGKRLGAVLAAAYDTGVRDFESLILLKGLGPRTMQSLALVSELIHGTPVRFSDPARFSFAHGGKDGHPFPVKTKTFDETISQLREALSAAKLGRSDKLQAMENLSKVARSLEETRSPKAHFRDLMEKEWSESDMYGGRTVFDREDDRVSVRRKAEKKDLQLKLFE
jgi:hypothetical protein